MLDIDRLKQMSARMFVSKDKQDYFLASNVIPAEELKGLNLEMKAY